MSALPSVTAIVAVGRDEEYLWNCLVHLVEQGLRLAVIDSSGRSLVAEVLAEAEVRHALDAHVILPCRDQFHLSEQIRAREALAARLASDWVLQVDVDEVPHSPHPGENLREALGRADASGCNAVNFEEFVFLPLDHDYKPRLRGPQPMRGYYFFEPGVRRLMRARQRTAVLSAQRSGGHRLEGPDLRLFPEFMVLRHYIVRDQAHATSKYTTRRFAGEELERGWHGNRVGFAPEQFRLPGPDELDWMDPGSHRLSRERPRRTHFWAWARAPGVGEGTR